VLPGLLCGKYFLLNIGGGLGSDCPRVLRLGLVDDILKLHPSQAHLLFFHLMIGTRLPVRFCLVLFYMVEIVPLLYRIILGLNNIFLDMLFQVSDH
jgi:hypothetical protein